MNTAFLVRVNGGQIIEKTGVNTLGELVTSLNLEGNYSVLINGETIGDSKDYADLILDEYTGDVLVSFTTKVKNA